MIRMTRISIAVACALGMGAALAQSVQRGDTVVSNSGKATQAMAQASSAAPIQTAQAGGASGGASTSGAAAAGGVSGGTIAAVTAAVAIAAIASSNSTTSH